MKRKKLLLGIIICMLIIGTCPTVFATTYSDNEAKQKQEVTTMEDLNFAFDLIYRLAREWLDKKQEKTICSINPYITKSGQATDW